MSLPESQYEDRPHSLAIDDVARERVSLLQLPHIKPLTNYVGELRRELSEGVPYFDPLDGGTRAEALIVLTSPGPRAVGTDFVSRNNPDPTALNTFNLLRTSQIERSQSVLWNIVPWNVSSIEGNADVTAGMIRRGIPLLLRLIELLPCLRCVVLCGRDARLARTKVERTSIPVFETFHPAAQSYNVPHQRKHMQQTFACVSMFLRGGKTKKPPFPKAIQATRNNKLASDHVPDKKEQPTPYSIAGHLEKSDLERRQLFAEIRSRILKLYPAAEERAVKKLVHYKSSKNFAEIHFHRNQLKIHIRPRLYADSLGWVQIREKAGYTMNRHFVIRENSELDYAMSLISQSLEDTLL